VSYSLWNFAEPGDNDEFGLPVDSRTAPLIDVLRRVLWLMENQPRKLSEFLGETRPNLDHLPVVAETLAGAKLAGNGSGSGRSLVASRGEEAPALCKLTTNWRMVIEANAKPLM
jgi:putative DNA methylase